MKNIVLFIFLVSAGLLASCSTVDEARKAQKGDSLLEGERTVTPAEMGIEAGKTYNLGELERVALRSSPSVFQAGQNLISAQLQLKIVKADYLPTFDLVAGYEAGTSNEFKRPQSSHFDGNGYGGVDFKLLIYDFGKTDAKVAQEIQNVVAAEKELILARVNSVYSVRKAFFELKRRIELNIVAEQAVAQYKEHLDHMLAKYEHGKGTKYDCSKARVDYDSSVLDQITSANNVRTAQAELVKTLGFDSAFDFLTGEGQMPDVEIGVDALMEIVRKTDPSLGILRANAEAAKLYIDEQIAELYPTISLSAEALAAGLSQGWPAIWNLTGGAEIAQNIFNGNRNINAIKQAVSQLRTARSQIAEYEQSVYAELTTARLNLNKAKKQYEVALASEKVAKENLELVTERFNVGKASSLERTDAQVSYTSAQADAVSAKYDCQDALAEIFRIIGRDPSVEDQENSKLK